MKNKIKFMLSVLICAYSNSSFAIVDGSVATGGEAFALSTVGFAVFKQGEMTSGCTATLLSEKIAITAAHCIDPDAENSFIAFGLNKDEITPRDLRPVLGIEIHPTWDSARATSVTVANLGDIALISFEGGVPSGFQAAEVLIDKDVLKDNTDVLIAGFGATHFDGNEFIGAGILRFANSFISNASLSATEIGVGQDSKISCRGDSGGGSFVNVNGKLKLWGVNSGTYDLKTPGQRAVCRGQSKYTSILAYEDWISKVMKGLSN